MIRHCFIVDSNGKVIDLTIFRVGRDKETDVLKYISFARLNEEEYLQYLHKADYNLSLYNSFAAIERDTLFWAMENGLFLI